jgi:hypothetical protein
VTNGRELAGLLEQLVRTDSVNPTLVSGAPARLGSPSSSQRGSSGRVST